MMKKALKTKVENALRKIHDPESGQDIISAGMVSGLQVANGRALFAIEVDPARGNEMESLRQQSEQAVKSVRGIKHVTAALTARRTEQSAAAASSASSSSSSSATSSNGAAHADPHGMEKNPRLSLPIKHIIAVASGKGGVGKSTIAVNLAVALAEAGYKTGLLDADIYGPSAPRMLGLPNEKPDLNDQKQLIPHEAHGLKVMSIGFMIEEEKPMIWRGPMVQSAIYQMLRDVVWGTQDDMLDILVVDMPPGTGDAQLTMAQKVPLSGAVIVSTPQDIALLDARRGLAMFEKVDVPVIGMIENMSTFKCPHCDHESHIFGHGGAKEEAANLHCDFLGEIPLTLDIREQSDAGNPVLAQGAVFKSVAQKVADYLRDKDE